MGIFVFWACQPRLRLYCTISTVFSRLLNACPNTMRDGIPDHDIFLNPPSCPNGAPKLVLAFFLSLTPFTTSFVGGGG